MKRLHMCSNRCYLYRPDASGDPCIEPEQTEHPGSPNPVSMQPRVISISRRGAGLLT
jgi:hypothetical protein